MRWLVARSTGPNCDVVDAVAATLPLYTTALQKSPKIGVQFKAECRGILVLYHGLTENDPTHLLRLKAKLVDMVRCQKKLTLTC